MSAESDHLRLLNLRFWGRHGHHSPERELGNRFEVDVDLQLDLAPAARLDQLSATLDVSRIYNLVRRQVEGEPCHLLETLAHRIATATLELDRVQCATIRVRKLNPPLAGAVQGIAEVEVTRRPADDPDVP